MKIDIRAKQFGRHFSTSEEEGPALTVQERRERRARLFCETASQRALRVAASLGEDMRRLGLRGLLGVASHLARRPAGVAGLPDPEAALAYPEGLCGLVNDMTPEGLLEGLARGLAPAPLFGKLVWWSPRERMVVNPRDFREPEAARAVLASAQKVTLDRDFDGVLRACRRDRRLSPRELHLYAALHDMGFAHSVEIRGAFGKLIGGAFGVALGHAFMTLGAFGENIATREAALMVMNRHLRRMGFSLHDLVRDGSGEALGFQPWPRAAYFRELLAASGFGRLGRWQAAPALVTAEPVEEELSRLQRAA